MFKRVTEVFDGKVISADNLGQKLWMLFGVCSV